MIQYPVLLLFSAIFPSIVYPTPLGSGDDYGIPRGYAHVAILNLTYRDPTTGEITLEEELEWGQFAMNSRVEEEWGWVIHILTTEGTNDGCAPAINAPPAGGERWIALIERGECQFHQKIVNAAVNLNASAVVIYDNEEGHLLSMKHKVEGVMSVFIRKDSGARIATLIDSGTRVFMHITLADAEKSQPFDRVNRSSVLFVSVSFIVLMIISLAWLVFYYVQRVRYAHTKDRLAKRLMNAAKKALNKMGQRTLKRGDKEIDTDFELCAICVESYRASEIIRILPCKHLFHKSCVDPWLIEHRTCPICKYDILQSSGNNVMGNRELTALTNLDASTLLLDSGGADTGRPSPQNSENRRLSPSSQNFETGPSPSLRRAVNRIPASSRQSLDPDRQLLLDTCPSPVGRASVIEGGFSAREGRASMVANGVKSVEGKVGRVSPREGRASMIEGGSLFKEGGGNSKEGEVDSRNGGINTLGSRMCQIGEGLSSKKDDFFYIDEGFISETGVNSIDNRRSFTIATASPVGDKMSPKIIDPDQIFEHNTFTPFSTDSKCNSRSSIPNRELAQIHVEPRPVDRFSSDINCNKDDNNDGDSDYDNMRKMLS